MDKRKIMHKKHHIICYNIIYMIILFKKEIYQNSEGTLWYNKGVLHNSEKRMWEDLCNYAMHVNKKWKFSKQRRGHSNFIETYNLLKKNDWNFTIGKNQMLMQLYFSDSFVWLSIRSASNK